MAEPIRGAAGGSNSKSKWVLFVIGLLFTLAVCAWTASHNVPMMAQGTQESFRVFGVVAALSGEAFLLFCYVFPFFIGGTQRIVTLAFYALMFLVLLFNSVVGYAQVAARETIPEIDLVVKFYGTYIAPFPVFSLVFFGMLAIIETMPAIKEANAKHNAQASNITRRADMSAWTAKQTDAMMERLPEIQRTLQAAAILEARAQVASMFKEHTGKELDEKELDKIMQSLDEVGGKEEKPTTTNAVPEWISALVKLAEERSNGKTMDVSVAVPKV